MVIRRADKLTESGALPSERILAAMAGYNEELVKAGVMISGEGLRSSAEGARVKFSKGKPSVTDGPFAETKELIAGYSMIHAKSLQEAIDWVKKWPAIDTEQDVEIEIRRMFELEDFVQGDAIERHAKLRDQVADGKPLLSANCHLSFNGDCEEAFKFYEQVGVGKIKFMMSHGNSPMAGEVSAEWHKKILHASMDIGENVIMGGDAPPGRYTKPQGFAVAFGVADPAEAERVFEALAKNGVIQMPLQQTFWAKRFGMLVDRFGIPWMVNCSAMQ
jgi:uncharacterized glyoxalase superfamily protein PhnB